MPRVAFRVCLIGLFTAVLILVGVPSLQAQADPAKDRVAVLIGFKQQPGPNEQALVRAFGGIIKYNYHLVPAIAARVPEAALQGLRNHPAVTVVDLDTKVYELDFASELDNTWGVKRIGAGDVHAADNTGLDVKVCVIDSGIDTNHPDLPLIVWGWDYVNNDGDPSDDRGHGTHVSGTIAALRNGTNVVGVAPGASILALKVLDANGSGSFSDVIMALQDCLAEGGQITNNSYGSSGDPGSTVKAAFDNAYAAGVLHVAAAGNSGNPPGIGDNVGYPARYDSVISVAATDQRDSRARFSSTGPANELAAPGVDIPSTYPDDTYAYGSGTSMASPHVAGAAALVFACGITDANGNGKLNDDVRARLTGTAQDLGSAGRDTHYGYGLVRADVAAADCGPVAPVIDIAVTSVSGPSSVPQGQTAAIDVIVTNVGNQDVDSSFDVTLNDGSALIGTQTVSGLSAGASTTLTFTWDTGGATIGAHTLTATHSFVPDDNETNDSSSTVVEVTEPVSGPPAAPTNLTASLAGRTVQLSWRDNSTNEDSFVIERCKKNKRDMCSFSEIGSAGANVTSYEDSNPPKRSTLVYRVKARNSAGDSNYSDEAEVITDSGK